MFLFNAVNKYIEIPDENIAIFVSAGQGSSGFDV
jgi:hypothetical protein